MGRINPDNIYRPMDEASEAEGLPVGRWVPPLLILKGEFEMENNEQDLTVGNVPKKLIQFALPLLGANLLQSFIVLWICWLWAVLGEGRACRDQ